MRGLQGRGANQCTQSAKIIQFPQHHVRASSVCFAANRAKNSAVTPAAFARSVAKTRVHHSEGILSLSRHFEIAGGRPPMSAAISAWESQSSMTERNDEGESTIPDLIRQLVLKDKDKVSWDDGSPQGHNVLMKKSKPISTFKDEFTARVAHARQKAGYTQATMAEALGFGPTDDSKAQGKYHKYEKRSLMPHYLIPQFCALCDITVGWLYNGPVVERLVEKRGRKPKMAPRRRAA